MLTHSSGLISARKMEEVCFSEMFAYSQNTTLRHNPEGHHLGLYSDHHENVKA
jgi:hypothetical protein